MSNTYDGKTPLPPFDYDEWVASVPFDHYDKDGNKTFTLTITNHPKPVPPAKFMIPFLEDLADEPIREVDEQVEWVEALRTSYLKGYDPFSGDSLKNIKSFEYFMEVRDENDKVIGIKERKVPLAQDEFAVSQTDKSDKQERPATRRKINQVVPDKETYNFLMGLIYDEDFKRKIEKHADDHIGDYHNED